MAQKKMETASEVEEKVIPDNKGSFVTTFWDQYEQSRERSEKLRESREDAYLTAIREVIKFNKHYRQSLSQLYDQTKKTNKEVVTEVIQQLNARKEEAKEEVLPVNTNEHEELKKQLKEVSGQLEKLAITPIKSFVQIVEQLEDNFEKNAESNITFARERRKAWLEVRKEYVNLARDIHLNLVERSKNSFKELVKTR